MRLTRTMLISALLCVFTRAGIATSIAASQTPPLQIALVESSSVSPATVTQWKKEGFNAVAVVLDERTSESAYRTIGRHILNEGLELYLWIEVARNPKLATEHPRWMASLGTHQDWQKNFPKFPEPGTGQVAKAFPWIPIVYREAFDAHLARIEELLKRAPSGWRGLLLNDLQGGPSSCGCGNLQCRWAVDHHVPSTAANLPGEDHAARFTAEVRKRAGDKLVVPVWTTECEEADLPADKHQGRRGTGFCGTVGCATAACPEVFTRQWSALVSGHNGPIGLLALHTSLQRTQREFGGGPAWVTNTIAYVNQTVPANGGKAVAPDQLWLVVEESGAAEERTPREVAAKAGVAAVVVARTRIEQSYEPRMISSK